MKLIPLDVFEPLVAFDVLGIVRIDVPTNIILVLAR